MSTLSEDQARGQIDLLLVEYNALRQDINNRISGQATLLGFAGASLAIILGTTHAANWILGVAGAVLAVLGASVWITNNLWIRGLGAQLKVIESRVNALAIIAYGPADEPLLGWQSSLKSPTGRLRAVPASLGLSRTPPASPAR